VNPRRGQLRGGFTVRIKKSISVRSLIPPQAAGNALAVAVQIKIDGKNLHKTLSFKYSVHLQLQTPLLRVYFMSYIKIVRFIYRNCAPACTSVRQVSNSRSNFFSCDEVMEFLTPNKMLTQLELPLAKMMIKCF